MKNREILQWSELKVTSSRHRRVLVDLYYFTTWLGSTVARGQAHTCQSALAWGFGLFFTSQLTICKSAAASLGPFLIFSISISLCVAFICVHGDPLQQNTGSAVPINYCPAIPLHGGHVHRHRGQIDIDE